MRVPQLLDDSLVFDDSPPESDSKAGGELKEGCAPALPTRDVTGTRGVLGPGFRNGCILDGRFCFPFTTRLRRGEVARTAGFFGFFGFVDLRSGGIVTFRRRCTREYG